MYTCSSKVGYEQRSLSGLNYGRDVEIFAYQNNPLQT